MTLYLSKSVDLFHPDQASSTLWKKIKDKGVAIDPTCINIGRLERT